jgi:hypothetical protein
MKGLAVFFSKFGFNCSKIEINCWVVVVGITLHHFRLGTKWPLRGMPCVKIFFPWGISVGG